MDNLMKILHTSDWHLGRKLYGKKRYDEFSSFLNWLINLIEEEKIDALLIAGDIFDTTIPTNKAQELYYEFLYRVSNSCCRHIVVTSGNHDSPTFLNAPKALLKALNVYVVGHVTQNLEDEIITLYHEAKAEAIICAVPYLRDKDLRTVESGETIHDKDAKLIQGIKDHYDATVALAEKKRDECEKNIPIIAMGHLFAAGGKTTDGDGVRELYVGSLAHVSGSIFPSSIDYLALGHLHIPQRVGKINHMRYCGSPIAMGFNEAKQDKKVIIVTFDDNVSSTIQEISVPCFQPLAHVSGSLDDIRAKLEQLKQEESNAWLEIEYTGADIVSNLRGIIDEILIDSKMEALKVRNGNIVDQVMMSAQEDENLDDLKPLDIFNRYLDACNTPEEQRDELIAAHNEIIQSIYDEDHNAQ